jgi:hypothetical protein
MKKLVTIPTIYGDCIVPCVTVPEVAPQFSELEFVLHKSPEWTSDWTVSEASTGFAIVRGDDQDEVVERAKAVLASKTADQVRQAIEATPAQLADRDAKLRAA